LEVAARIFHAMAGGFYGDASAIWVDREMFRPFLLFVVGCAAMVTWAFPETWSGGEKAPGAWRAAILLILFVLTIAALVSQESNPFLYFQF
jgi:hypothetical protein